MRRRLRRQTQVREALLLDLGALVFELHRQGRREPELLQAKAAELLAVDDEVRALSDSLGTGGNVLQLTAAGIAGSCSQCAAIMPMDARYCSSCGASVQVALGPGVEQAPPLEAYDPSAAVPPLPPEQDEPPTEIPTEERAALEAGDFEQADPGPPVGEPPWADPETAVHEPATSVPSPRPSPSRSPRTYEPEPETYVPETETYEPRPEQAENGTEETSSGARGWLKRRRGA